MRLGFVSAILPELSLEELVAFAAAAGFECVELMCWPLGKAERRYAGVTHLDVAELSDARIDSVQRLFDGAGVTISGLGYYPNALAPDPVEALASRAQIRRVIEAASRLHVGIANTFIGRDWTRSVDDNWAKFEEVWPPICAFASECGVRIGIENCPMLFTNDEWPGGKNMAVSPAIWRRMFAHPGCQSLGLNYDPSHLIWQQMDEVRPIREFASRIWHVHAKDVRIDRDRLDDVGILATPNSYHTPKLPGLGQVNWSAFFSALSGAGYRGSVCIEAEDRAYEGSLEDRKAALRQAARYLRQFMA